jgi:hypothetical protein
MAEDGYVSYLLRLWRSEVAGRPAWRASLESTRTGERQTFSLEELLAYLQNPGSETGTDENSGPGGFTTC